MSERPEQQAGEQRREEPEAGQAPERSGAPEAAIDAREEEGLTQPESSAQKMPQEKEGP
jgi:hypothetical protein